MSDLPRLAEHNRAVPLQTAGAAGVLCDLCGTEMVYDAKARPGVTDPPSVPVKCPGCRYRGHKSSVSQAQLNAAVESLRALLPEPEPEPEPESPPT